MKRIAGLTILLLLGAIAAIAADPGLVGNLRAISARMPFYRDNKLEYYVRSQEITRHGGLMTAVKPVIDSIREESDVNDITNVTDQPIYPLYAPLETVLTFWNKRHFSKGILTADSTELDQVNRTAVGDGPVFVRSPMLDLDGVGFVADFNQKTVEVKSHVRIAIRSGGELTDLKPQDADKKLDKQAKLVKISADKLFINMPGNLITLAGHVKVIDPAAVITADKLELDLAERSAAGATKKTAGKPAAKKDDFTPESGEITRARFLGNVLVVRTLAKDEAAAGEQKVTADRLVYEVKTAMIELTGKRPRLMRGKDFATADKIIVHRDTEVVKLIGNTRIETAETRRPVHKTAAAATMPMSITANNAELDYPRDRARLSGLVHVYDPVEKVNLTCDAMNIDLAAAAIKTTLGKRAKTAAASPLAMRFGTANSGGSGKQVKAITCLGKVKMKRQTDEGSETADAGQATYYAADERIVLEKNPVLVKDKNQIQGDKMEISLPSDRLLVSGNSVVTIDAMRIDANSLNQIAPSSPRKTAAATAPARPMVVKSRNADFNLGGNKLTFTDQVDGDNGTMKLNCRQLDIYLKDSGKKSAASGTLSGSKTPERAVATGNVVASDPQAVLHSDVLELLFGERAVPGKTEVEKIFANGNVKIENIPAPPGSAPRSGAAAGMLSRRPNERTTLTAGRGEINLLSNQGDFYDKVRVREPASELQCDHLNLQAAVTTDVIPPIGALNPNNPDAEFPQRIGIGAGRELKRVTAYDNVVMLRKLPSGERQRATGSKAVYVVKDRNVVMTGTPEKLPTAITADGGMVGETVTVLLDGEEIEIANGNALTRTDKFNFD